MNLTPLSCARQWSHALTKPHPLLHATDSWWARLWFWRPVATAAPGWDDYLAGLGLAD
jgi:hypothetical protein